MGNSVETKRRILFCCQYAMLGDVTEAARCAGYPPETAAQQGAELLRIPRYRQTVREYRAALQDSPMAIVQSGLARLAFGRTNDAIQLVLAEELPPPEQIQRLDLFSVSSIKRDKSGGMEVHFFDRIKAMTSLYEYSGAADGKAAAHALLEALSGGAEGDTDAD